jgi:hypothetical protein
MANFAHYFNSRFAGCQCLAHAFDQHRNRDVKIYQIPGVVDCVGVSDGVDRWIAPVAPELFSVNIQKLLRDLQEGVSIKLPVNGLDQSKKEPRSARRRLLLDSEAPAPAPRARRTLIA